MPLVNRLLVTVGTVDVVFGKRVPMLRLLGPRLMGKAT